MEDEKLIEAVRNRECLYNLQHPKYMDIKFKAIIWKEVAEELGLSANSAAECKQRWQNIRSCYRKHRGRNQTRIGQAAGPVRPHKFWNNLDFLAPFFQEKSIREEASTDDFNSSIPTRRTDTAEEETDEDVECQPPKRGKTEDIQGGLIDCISRCVGLIERTVNSDETENSERARMLLFFKSMALEVCQLDVRRQNIVKSTLLAKVSEMQEQLLEETLANNANTPSSDETGV